MLFNIVRFVKQTEFLPDKQDDAPIGQELVRD